MHELERRALTDPFLADALEGYTRSDSAAAPHLSLLQKQLEERIALQQEKKNMFHFGWQRISVAAAACLLFISASILFWMKGSRNQQRAVVESKQKSVDVTLMDPDSVKAFSSDEAILSMNAEPVGGWKNFQKYLKENKRTTIAGIVVLSFKVDAAGKAANVDVLKSSASELNNEAIRLIKDGPKWKSNGEGFVNVKIEF